MGSRYILCTAKYTHQLADFIIWLCAVLSYIIPVINITTNNNCTSVIVHNSTNGYFCTNGISLLTGKYTEQQLECGPMPNMMVAQPNIGGALCSTPQSLAVTPTTICRAVTLPRRETSWKLQGYPKLVNQSQPLVGRSSPYYEKMWRTYWCLTFFFRLSIRALVHKT